MITPWHGCACTMLDGRILIGHRSQYENDPKLELVMREGKPSHFREKSELYNWTEPVTVDPLYPCGLIITPSSPSSSDFKTADMSKVRQLAEHNSPIILRNFSGTKDRDLYLEKAKEMGTIQSWLFGEILELMDKGSENAGGLNNVLSAEPMPFHFDGMFKTHNVTSKRGSVRLVPNPPK